jgi:hypothetical protein
MARHVRPCPVCGIAISVLDVRGDGFSCPGCGEWLRNDLVWVYTNGALSIVISAFVTWKMGFREAMFFFITVGGSVLVLFVGVFIQSFFFLLPAYTHDKGRSFDKTLSLFGSKSDGDKKSDGSNDEVNQ